jgi:hypothetical protein
MNSLSGWRIWDKYSASDKSPCGGARLAQSLHRPAIGRGLIVAERETDGIELVVRRRAPKCFA